MRDVVRTIFTVGPYSGGWAVEHGGSFFDQCGDKEEAKAAANKRARASQDSGTPCLVRISGEPFFARA